MGGGFARFGIALLIAGLAVLVTGALVGLVGWKTMAAMAESTRGSSSIGAGLAVGMAGIGLLVAALVVTLIVGAIAFSLGVAAAHTKFSGSTPWWGLIGYPVAAIPLGLLIYGYLWWQGYERNYVQQWKAAAVRRSHAQAEADARNAREAAAIERPQQSPPVVGAPTSDPATPPNSPDAKVGQAATEVSDLLGNLYYPGAEVSAMSQRDARSLQGHPWPSITLVPPDTATPDQIIDYYKPLAPDATNEGQEEYRANIVRPGDGVNSVLYVCRAKYGPEAGKMVVMVMSP